MGIKYFLCCGACHEFLPLYKWPIVEDDVQKLHDAAFDRDQTDRVKLMSGDGVHCFALAVSEDELRRGIARTEHERDDFSPSIDEYIALASAFVDQHGSHELLLCCDVLEPPWNTAFPGWERWRELPGPNSYEGVFLPLNLIDDFGFTSWEQVIGHLEQRRHWLLSDPPSVERLHSAFIAEIEKRRREHSPSFTPPAAPP